MHTDFLFVKGRNARLYRKLPIKVEEMTESNQLATDIGIIYSSKNHQ